MSTKSPESPASPARAAATVAIVGVLAPALAKAMRHRARHEPGEAIACAAQIDELPETAEIVVIADLPDRADRPLLGGGPQAYGDRLATLLQERARARHELVVWLTVPYQAYDDHGPWTPTAIRALNKRTKPVCAEHGLHVVELAAKLERWGAGDLLTTDPKPTLNEGGCNAMAAAIEKLVKQRRIRSALERATCPRLDPARFDGLATLLRESPADADRLLIDRMTLRDAPFEAGGGTDSFLTPDLRLQTERWDEVQLDDPIRWNLPGPDRAWESCFLALDFVRGLVCRFEEDGNLAHLGRALDAIRSWREANPPSAPVAPRAWHEGTTTKRLNTLAMIARSLLRALQMPGGATLHATLGRPGQLVELLALLEQHATFLLNPDLYVSQGNHGLRQDTILLSAAATFPDFMEASRWLDTVSDRVWREQVVPGVSADGVWLEHSPGYHQHVLSRLWTILELLEFTGRTTLSTRLRDVLDRMLRFTAYVVQPDGCRPPVGDSLADRAHPRPPTLFETLPFGASALFSTTQGHAGVKPTERDAFFPDGGWAILRDAWGDADDFDQTVYVNFHANLHSAKHKHADDLSFLLSGKGRHWIVDCGRLNNELDDPMKDHFRLDAAAHNTYTVDGRGYRFKRNERDPFGIVDTHSSETGGFVVAVNGLYEKARVTRLLAFVRDEPLIVLVDELVSHAGDRVWASHLHLDHDLETTPRADVIAARCAASGWTLDVAGRGADVEIVRGQRDPLLGWLTVGWNRAVPAPVIVRRVEGETVTAVTALRLRRDDEPALRSVSLVRSRGHTHRVELDIGGRTRDLEVRTGRRPSLRWR